MLMPFFTTREHVKFKGQAIITSLTAATTILIQWSPAGWIPGIMLMELSPLTMAHSLMLMQSSPTTLDHEQFSINFPLVPPNSCNAHLMQHYNYHQIMWILTDNWMRIEWELTFHFCLGSCEIYLRLKTYLLVEISSDIVTKHCCQYAFCLWCFATPTAGKWLRHGKWLHNQETPWRIMWFDLTQAGQRWI